MFTACMIIYGACYACVARTCIYNWCMLYALTDIQRLMHKIYKTGSDCSDHVFTFIWYNTLHVWWYNRFLKIRSPKRVYASGLLNPASDLVGLSQGNMASEEKSHRPVWWAEVVDWLVQRITSHDKLCLEYANTSHLSLFKQSMFQLSSAWKHPKESLWIQGRSYSRVRFDSTPSPPDSRLTLDTMLVCPWKWQLQHLQRLQHTWEILGNVQLLPPVKSELWRSGDVRHVNSPPRQARLISSRLVALNDSQTHQNIESLGPRVNVSEHQWTSKHPIAFVACASQPVRMSDVFGTQAAKESELSNVIQAGQYLTNLPRQDSNASSIQSSNPSACWTVWGCITTCSRLLPLYHAHTAVAQDWGAISMNILNRRTGFGPILSLLMNFNFPYIDLLKMARKTWKTMELLLDVQTWESRWLKPENWHDSTRPIAVRFQRYIVCRLQS